MSLTARAASKRLGAAAGAALGGAVLAAAPQPSRPPPAATARAFLIVGGHRLEQVGEALARGGQRGRHVVAGDLVRLVAAQDPAGDRLAVDLVRALREAGPAGGGGPSRERAVRPGG